MSLTTPLIPANPNTLTNGTPADATQVMANFNNLVNNINALLNASTGAGYVGITSDTRWGGGASVQDALGLLKDQQQLSDTGSVNALVVTPAGGLITANVSGMFFLVKPANTTTTSTPTLKVGTAPAVTIVNTDGSAHAPASIQANRPALFWVDTVNSQAVLINPITSSINRNFFIDPCCQVAQIGDGVNVLLSTSHTYGQVDLVQCWATGSAVSAGSITHNHPGGALTGMGGASQYSCAIFQATITGSGKVFFRKWIESRDAIALSGKTVQFSVLGWQGTGGAINAFLTLNKFNVADNSGAVTLLATGSTVSLPSSTTTAITMSYTFGASDGNNGVELILEMDCGAVITQSFQTTDWQACIGALPSACAVPNFDSSLHACQRYYEQSYNYGTSAGTATAVGAPMSLAGGTLWQFAIPFMCKKVANPTVTLYSTSGTVNDWRDITAAADVAMNPATPYMGIINVTTSALATDNHVYQGHWVADARL